MCGCYFMSGHLFTSLRQLLGSPIWQVVCFICIFIYLRINKDELLIILFDPNRAKPNGGKKILSKIITLLYTLVLWYIASCHRQDILHHLFSQTRILPTAHLDSHLVLCAPSPPAPSVSQFVQQLARRLSVLAVGQAEHQWHHGHTADAGA